MQLLMGTGWPNSASPGSSLSMNQFVSNGKLAITDLVCFWKTLFDMNTNSNCCLLWEVFPVNYYIVSKCRLCISHWKLVKTASEIIINILSSISVLLFQTFTIILAKLGDVKFCIRKIKIRIQVLKFSNETYLSISGKLFYYPYFQIQ